MGVRDSARSVWGEVGGKPCVSHPYVYMCIYVGTYIQNIYRVKAMTTGDDPQGTFLQRCGVPSHVQVGMEKMRCEMWDILGRIYYDRPA